MAISMHYHAVRFVQVSSSFGVGNDFVLEGNSIKGRTAS